MAWLLGGETEPDPRFQRNAAGRPIIPDEKLQLAFIEEAPRDKKLLALAWAKEWLGIPGGFDCEQALAELDAYMSGRRQDHLSDAGRILLVARRALYLWREAATHERTRHAFTWLRFVAIEGEPNCCDAKALSGKLIADGCQSLLPLPSCTAPKCGCLYLPLTEGQRRRLSANKT